MCSKNPKNLHFKTLFLKSQCNKFIIPHGKGSSMLHMRGHACAVIRIIGEYRLLSATYLGCKTMFDFAKKVFCCHEREMNFKRYRAIQTFLGGYIYRYIYIHTDTIIRTECITPAVYVCVG